MINNLVYEIKVNVLKQLIQKGPTLDMGCWDKKYTQHMTHVIGIDISDEYDGKKGCPDFIRELADTGFDNDSFSNVCLLDTLEHTDNPKRIVAEAYRLLQPNGILTIIDPSDPILFWARIIFGRFTDAFKGNPDHIHDFNRAKLEDITKGLFVLEKYIPYGISTGYRFRSTKNAIVLPGYVEHWTLRMIKSFVVTFLMYWLIRTPIQIFFTEYMDMWYIMSNFVAGVILTIIGFVVSELYVWKR